MNWTLTQATLLLVLILSLTASRVEADEPKSPATPQAFSKQHCVSCHSGDEPEGNVSLDELKPVTDGNATLWQRVLMQVATGEMPPDGEPRPKLADREVVIDWIIQSMTQAGIDPQLPGGPLPGDGNQIDHDRLFSGRFKGPAWSPPRLWRKSQSQYDSLMEQLWVIPRLRYEKAHSREDSKWAAYGYSQPFPSLDPEHFTNYSGSVHADEAVLRALMDAGGQIAERLTSDKTVYDKELQPPHAVGIPSIRRGSKWERFKIEPPARHLEFEPFVTGAESPSAEEQRAAVHRTFDLILLRSPTEAEFEQYGGLLKQSIDRSGRLAALRGLITAVVVSPEFVFRMEVGMSPADEHGRRKLSSSPSPTR